MIYQHCRFYLADQTLVATDRSTMAAALEVRAPFLDPALVELACRIPTRFKLRAGTTKYLLKRTVDDLLPAAIVNRRKQGLGSRLRRGCAGRSGTFFKSSSPRLASRVVACSRPPRLHGSSASTLRASESPEDPLGALDVRRLV